MTNSPKSDSKSSDEISQIWKAENCDSRLTDCGVEIIDSRRFAEAESAVNRVTEYRFEQRTSIDGKCIVQEDVYVLADGTEKRIIVTLEIDGEDFFVSYDKPRSL